jgi:membrane-bound inhibitor of C-type lysozyme
MKLAVLSLIAATLAASGAHAASKPIKAMYDCEGGSTLKVVFKGGKATVTPEGSKSVVLKQSLAADGFSYTKGKYNLRGRGDDATWTTARHALQCHARG